MKLIKYIFYSIYSILILGFGYDKKVKNAYKIINDNNKIKIIDKIVYEIENSKIAYDKKKFSKMNKYFENDLNYDFTLNQLIHYKFMLNKFFTSKLQMSLAYNELFYFPLPDEWLKIVEKNNVNVIFSLSRFLFKRWKDEKS